MLPPRTFALPRSRTREITPKSEIPKSGNPAFSRFCFFFFFKSECRRHCYLGAFGNAFTTVFSTLGVSGPTGHHQHVIVWSWFYGFTSPTIVVMVALCNARRHARAARSDGCAASRHAAYKECSNHSVNYGISSYDHGVHQYRIVVRNCVQSAALAADHWPRVAKTTPPPPAAAAAAAAAAAPGEQLNRKCQVAQMREKKRATRRGFRLGFSLQCTGKSMRNSIQGGVAEEGWKALRSA